MLLRPICGKRGFRFGGFGVLIGTGATFVKLIGSNPPSGSDLEHGLNHLRHRRGVESSVSGVDRGELEGELKSLALLGDLRFVTREVGVHAGLNRYDDLVEGLEEGLHAHGVLHERIDGPVGAVDALAVVAEELDRASTVGDLGLVRVLLRLASEGEDRVPVDFEGNVLL